MNKDICLAVSVPAACQDMLVRQGIIMGYTRVDPRRRWSDSERREAMRHAITRMIVEKSAHR